MGGFLARFDEKARNLGGMMACCGIDSDTLAFEQLGYTMVSVVRRCMACQHSERCRAWLESPEPVVEASPPAFCPNAETFRRRQRR